MKHHIVTIDNDYGHIAGVTLHSSYNTREEAEAALLILEEERSNAHVSYSNAEKRNYQRYLEWAANATIECPNGFGGFNWTQKPGHQHHEANIKSVPLSEVEKFDGQCVVEHRHMRIKSDKPLKLTKRKPVAAKYWLEYHLVGNEG